MNIPTLTPQALEALSYVIVTATEGGFYTREDFHEWKDYKFEDTAEGFRAEVTVSPSPEAYDDGEHREDIRLTPEELGRRLSPKLADQATAAHHKAMIARLLAGDEDVAGEMDVIDSGAMLQIAVYGDVIFG